MKHILRLLIGLFAFTTSVQVYAQTRPDNVHDVNCRITPQANNFDIIEKYSSSDVHSMTTPLVADMDGDGYPEIVACCATGGAWSTAGFHVIDGRTGVRKYTISTPSYLTHGQCVTIADVDKDGKSELFIIASNKRLYAYAYDGTPLWNQPVSNFFLLSAADINADGHVQLVAGPHVFDAVTGTPLLSGSMQTGGTGYGAPHNQTPYYMTALADMDNDGVLELCAGKYIYKIDITNYTGTDGNTFSVLRTADTDPGLTYYDGQTFVMDFDNDGDMDVCVLGRNTGGSGKVNPYVWDGQTSEIIGYITYSTAGCYGEGSVPYAGDLNGDDFPEFVFATSNGGMFAVTYDANEPTHIREYARVVAFAETAGFTVFDFNQDGRCEIVYRGYSGFYIVDGITMQNLSTPMTAYSGTVAEYPIVADVDADGHAEIILCRAYSPWNGSNAQGYVSVYGSKTKDAWGSARKVWNQWSYNVVNINEDMTVPRGQFDISTQFANGKRPFNNFLQQATMLDQDGNIYTATADAEMTPINNIVTYNNDSMRISLTFRNQGDVTLKAPFCLTIYKDTVGGTVIHVDTIKTDLLPNNKDTTITYSIHNLQNYIPCEKLVFAINDDSKGVAQQGGNQLECDTTNNLLIRSSFVAMKDTVYMCPQATSININPLANDYCFYPNESGTLRLRIQQAPTKGTATISGTSLTYTTNQVADIDSLNYRITRNNDTAYAWIFIIKSVKIATAPDITAETVYTCPNTSTTLTATSHLTNPTFNWYADAELTTLLHTGDSYITPTLPYETSFFVTVQNADTCENLPGTAKEVFVRFHPTKRTDIIDSVCVGSDYSRFSFTLPVQNTPGSFLHTRYPITNEGCYDTVNLTLKVIANPVIDLGEDKLICAVEQPQYTIQAPAGYNAYLWISDNSTAQALTVNTTGTYTVEVQKSICFGRDSVTITFDDFRYTLNGETTICPGASTILQPDITGVAYKWKNDDNTTSTERTFTAKSQGWHRLTITNNNGCKYTDSLYVTISALPDIYISGGDDFCENEQTTLSVSTTDGVKVGWNDDNTNTAQLFVTKHGTYTAWAENIYHCRHDSAITIEPCPCDPILSNAFSPNGDGKNDKFYPIINSSVVHLEIYIYNRWGRLVFESSRDCPCDSNISSPELYWDGKTSDGDDCQTGVYYCLLKYSCETAPERILVKQSSVTLLK